MQIPSNMPKGKDIGCKAYTTADITVTVQTLKFSC